ncbi:MAG TPA: hypothetical protein VK043_11055 [Burkholderiales bacterium]|nr:hypothetical protein [Burkholderiales bacterium]
MERTLVQLLKVLNASGISAAARLAPDGRVGLWLGDGSRGICTFAFFRRSELDRAVRWLADRSVVCYPASDFAKTARIISRLVHGAAAASAGDARTAGSRRPPSLK